MSLAGHLIGLLRRSPHIQRAEERHILVPAATDAALTAALLEEHHPTFLVDALPLHHAADAALRELMRIHRARLVLVGAEAEGDFLLVNPKLKMSYDGVVLLPPLGQEFEHVKHAHAFLRPGGRLVAAIPKVNLSRLAWLGMRSPMSFGTIPDDEDRAAVTLDRL